MPDAAMATGDIDRRLDAMPVTLLHGAIVALCALGFTFDLLEVALGSALAAVFSVPARATPPFALSLLLAAMYLGAIVGAPLLGWCADRYGRRLALMAALWLLAATSLGAAFSHGIAALTWWRCAAGFALGGYPPLMIAYLTDLAPAGRRGVLVLVAVAIGSLGPAAGIFLVRSLDAIEPFGIEGWRWGFLVGAPGAAAVALLFWCVPESARWLQARGRFDEAEQACRRLEASTPLLRAPPDSAARHGQPAPPVAPMPRRRRWALVAGLFFLSPWSTVAFPLLAGAMLTQKGFRLSDTLLYVGLAAFGPLAGTLVAAAAIDRIGRRTAMALCAAAIGAGGAVFALAMAPALLVCSSFFVSLSISLLITVLNLYAAEMFSTPERAVAIAGAWACNRAGAALAPLLLLPLMLDQGPVAMCAVIGASLLASMALLRVAPPGRRPGGALA